MHTGELARRDGRCPSGDSAEAAGDSARARSLHPLAEVGKSHGWSPLGRDGVKLPNSRSVPYTPATCRGIALSPISATAGALDASVARTNSHPPPRRFHFPDDPDPSRQAALGSRVGA
jgi:hypothetical protein